MVVAGVGLHLTEMKVKQLAEELGARGAPKSGRKRALQLRLRALMIVAAALPDDDEAALNDDSSDSELEGEIASSIN